MPAENAAMPWLDKEVLDVWLGTHVVDVEMTDATVKGDNYLSVIHRLKVRTTSGDTQWMLVKRRIEKGTTAEVMKDSSIFRKEQCMYSDTLPRMEALLRHALPDEYEPLGPKSFYSCRTFLVMEDLSPAGFKMGDRLQGLDLKHCGLVMRTLGRFHAASILMHQQDPNCMDEYAVSFFSEPCLLESWKRCFTGMVKNLIAEMETWTEEWQKYVLKLRQVQDDIVERVQKTTRRNDSGLNVLAHGDLWVNNFLFDADVRTVRFLDFQLCNYTSPAIDLHLFICTSASLDVRQNHTDILLREYHSSLCHTLAALGYEDTFMTLEELHQEFHRKSMYGLWAIVAPAACMLALPDCGFELDDALERGETPGPSMFSDNYKKAVRVMLPVLDKMGAFDHK